MDDAVLSWVFFILGCITGSFLNVCIVRLPQEKSIVFPSSHCPKCKKNILWYDNIPILSWIFLRGRCRFCKETISPIYPFVELLTGITFLFFYKYYGFQLVLLPLLLMVSGFIITIFVDLKHRIIPDEVTVGGMYVGIVCSAFIPALHMESRSSLGFGGLIAGILVLLCAILSLLYPFVCKSLYEQYKKESEGVSDWLINVGVVVALVIISLINYLPDPSRYFLSLDASLAGVLVGGGLVYFMGLMGDMVFRKESMGGGDVKFMAMVGAFLGWKLALLSFFIAPFFGAVYGIIEKIRTKDSTIAYGPFLVAGTLVSLFYGNDIIRWILNGGLYGH